MRLETFPILSYFAADKIAAPYFVAVELPMLPVYLMVFVEFASKNSKMKQHMMKLKETVQVFAVDLKVNYESYLRVQALNDVEQSLIDYFHSLEIELVHNFHCLFQMNSFVVLNNSIDAFLDDKLVAFEYAAIVADSDYDAVLDLSLVG